MKIDARIPVAFGLAADLRAEDALLTDQAIDLAVPTARLVGGAVGHAASCLCCVPRSQVGDALGRLFQARARGETVFFRRVLAIVDDAEAVRAAVRGDRLAAAWFRLSEF